MTEFNISQELNDLIDKSNFIDDDQKIDLINFFKKISIKQINEFKHYEKQQILDEFKEQKFTNLIIAVLERFLNWCEGENGGNIQFRKPVLEQCLY